MNLHEEVNPEVYFYLSNGNVIKSVYELFKALDHMDNSIFSHHVNSERNDFSNWIGDIYRNKVLANGLKKCKTRKAAKKCLGKELKKDGKTVLKKNKENQKERQKLQKRLEKRQKKWSSLQKKLQKKLEKRQKKWEKKRKELHKGFKKRQKEKEKIKKIVAPSKKSGILKLLSNL